MSLAAPDPGTGNMVSVFLNWNQYGNSLTDLDLFVLDKTGAGPSPDPAPIRRLHRPDFLT
jgi:hypothetical protein